ncbi:MAG TPA: cytochrome b/b6 domain-containing protein [Mucilaginibacter sp.]|nr:cytochrome b/b6 domain-containing protein [Mucilaginibacter sp.]
MDIIEPEKQQGESTPGVKKYSRSLRLWHWANAVIISGSLLTVLINSTVMNGQSILSLVNQQLDRSGIKLTFQQARPLVSAMRDRVWDYHKDFGYCLAALFIFRLLLELFQLADQKLLRKIKSSRQILQSAKIGSRVKSARHDLVVKLLYLAFYALLLIMVCTGLTLAFGDGVPSLKPVLHTIKDIHGFCMYPILIFIAVHLAGVFLAERKENKGIVSDMINGGE